ncbi:MAG: biotin--[acetyl-CoA-carboxylase] ligase [Rhodobacterales bacterium]|nr:MAG: biotin--[acetyl-CoA-carboxylase] ligase [Rhodobacterales bacterium]
MPNHPSQNTGWPDGVGRIVLPEVDSTLSEAARRAPDLSAPTWILALKQTAGRGRRGRSWSDPAGNFAATLLMRPQGGAGQAAMRSFIAALALYDAIVAVSGRSAGLALKWPNDVLLNGGKIAGILLESTGTAGAMNWLSIGIGVNLLTPPDAVEPGAMRPVSLFNETGAAVQPQEFLNALAPAFARYEAQFTDLGFAPIRTAWLNRAARLGQVITARTGTAEFTGTFETIDDSGALILNTPQGRQAIPAGEVYF